MNSTTRRERTRRDSARRALTRQLLYQTGRSEAIRGHEDENVDRMTRKGQRISSLLAAVATPPEKPSVLEVGSGGRGVIFQFPSEGLRVGFDPLAVEYVSLFPVWQGRVENCAGLGEALPFGNGVFDVVLCDNVIDHAEDPAGIVKELVRVLRPGGLMYFTVNVHHPFYQWVARLHAAWNAAGIDFEIGPFADHTVHFTRQDVQRMLRTLPVRIEMEDDGVAKARAAANTGRIRHAGDLLKRIFFKNARYEMVALRE